MKSRNPFIKARQIARSQILDFLPDSVLLGEGVDVVSSTYVEEKSFWIFFRNKDIQYPSFSAFAASAAYAVGRNGKFLAVADFSNSPEEMADLIKRLDVFFSSGN